jgi:hypothetical protein
MNRTLLKLMFALCALVAMPARAEEEAHLGRPVKPGQLFASRLLNVHAPDAEGWILAGVGDNGIGFARRGTDRDETYGAQIVLFNLAPAQSSDELVAAIRKQVETTNPPPRFAVLETSYEYSALRAYPCVRFKGSFDDKEALTTAGTRVTMKLQVVALYCRHPSGPLNGFFVSYSHRGAAAIPDLDAPAQRFIDGVQVPPQGKPQ